MNYHINDVQNVHR